MAERARRRSRLWHDRDFVRLWAGQSISELGSQVSLLALPWLALTDLHASALAFSLLRTLGFLPFVVLALPAGVWVDRVRCRPLLIAGDATRVGLLAYVPIAWATGTLTIVQLLCVEGAVGACTVVFDVAYQSYVPALVGGGELVDANAKLKATASIAEIAGPGLAGVLIAAISAPLAIATDALSFLAATAFTARIAAGEAAPAPTAAHDGDGEGGRPPAVSELAEGLAFVTGHPQLRPLALCTAATNLFYGMVTAIAVLFMQRTLHLSSGWTGLVLAGAGAGALAAALGARRLQATVGIGRAIWAAAALAAAGTFAYPLAPAGSAAIPLLLGGSVLVGIGQMTYNVAQVSLRQAITPRRLQGRMNATMRWLVWGPLPLGSLLGGVIASAAQPRAALWSGAAGCAAAVAPVALPAIRGLREIPDSASPR